MCNAAQVKQLWEMDAQHFDTAGKVINYAK
jgi:hypothetical protein